MKRIITIIFIYISLNTVLYSQTKELNHEKYWYYRYRLVNSFLKPGLGNGYSIPASRRAMDGHIHFGDATMDLGWYWAVLATEYRLLQLHNQSTDKTVEELYYALQAFNRLDYYAEVYWSQFCNQQQYGYSCLCNNYQHYTTGSLNGFFIRDDVMDGLGAQSILGDLNDPNSNFHHFNNFNRIPGNMVTVYNVESDLNINNSPDENDCKPDDYPIEMSTDQIVHLYMGLMLINQFVGASESYTPAQGHPVYSDGTSNIKLIARDITHRITDYLRNNNWQIKNPVNDLCIIGVTCKPYSTDNNCVSTQNTNCTNNISNNCFGETLCGSSAAFWAWPFATAANIITGHSPVSVSMPYHNAYSVSGGLSLWSAYNASPFPLVQDDDYAQLLGAITNSANTAILSSKAAQRDTEIYPLLKQALWGGGNLIANSTYKSLINQAPCQGPYNLGNGVYANHQWSSEHRFRKPNSRGGNPYPFYAGEYNGLDYMLLYNLYSIVKPDEVVSYYYDMRETFINVNFPLTGIFPIGSHLLPLETWAFNTISANNQIAANGNVTYRAGEVIYLNPGFHAAEGSYFKGYIDNFECEDNDGPYRNTETVTNLHAKEVYNSYYTNIPLETNDLQFEAFTNTWSKITRIQTTIYPNPAKDILIIEITPSNFLYMEIFSSLGNIVYKGTLHQQKNHIDLSILHEGIYYLRLYDTEMNAIETKKIIKKN